MNDRPQTKMCWNCEGNIQINEQFCPYCRVEIEGPSNSIPRQEEPSYAPIYRTIVPSTQEAFFLPPQSPLAAHSASEEQKLDADPISENDQQGDDTLIIIGGMSLLMGGLIFLLFGVVLLFFGSEGYFVLRWSDNYWPFYLLLALPMLFFGWHFTMHLDSPDPEK